MSHQIPEPANPLERTVRYIFQFITTSVLHLHAYFFIRKHKPWEGIHQYGWTMKILLGTGILIGVYLFYNFFTVVIDTIRNPQVFGASLSGIFTDFSLEKFSWLFGGLNKYLVLILIEILTFHIVQRTLEIKVGRPPDHSFKAFLRAEERMIGIAFLSWVLESILIGLVNIPLDMLGLDILKKPVGWIIQFYFVGFALIDNYHECYGLKIDESRKRTWEVAGIAVSTGMVAYVLMFIPLVGVIAASMLGAVTASMAMEQYKPVTESELALYAEKRTRKKK